MQHPVIVALDSLTAALQSSSPDMSIIAADLAKIQAECDKDLAHRIQAGKNGAFPLLLKACRACECDNDMFLKCINTLCSLCNGQPDFLEHNSRMYFLTQLQKHQDTTTITAAAIVRLIRLTCVMHETNRQAYVEQNLIPILMSMLEAHKDKPDVVREVCIGLKILVADDDVRVPFGKGHEHAKMIVLEQDALRKIMAICEGNLYTLVNIREWKGWVQ